jgi:predicted nuclease of restriction endonuclease-like RecB superfamily
MPKNQKKKWQQQQTASKSKQRGIKHGYRSGLEDKAAAQIKAAGVQLLYETDKVNYVVPERNAKYTPDFRLPKKGGFFYVETKGIWNVGDRQKHLLIKQQHPDLDIRFVFSNCNSKLYKGSKTTYAAYCDKHGFVYSHKTIPEEWLHEGN